MSHGCFIKLIKFLLIIIDKNVLFLFMETLFHHTVQQVLIDLYFIVFRLNFLYDEILDNMLRASERRL